MRYGIIRNENDTKHFFRIIKPKEFTKRMADFINGQRKEYEVIAFLTDCQSDGLIKIKNSTVIIYNYAKM